MGDFDRALDALEQAIATRDPNLRFIGLLVNWEPKLAALPGYEAVLKKSGFDRFWQKARE
ncbi:MAG: hypothetical protein WEE89_13905 [Gemmatimonadota bacterium]